MATIEYKGIRICTKETFDTLKANNELIVGKQYLVVDETFAVEDIEGLLDDLDNKVDVVEGARLITQEEIDTINSNNEKMSSLFNSSLVYVEGGFTNSPPLSLKKIDTEGNNVWSVALSDDTGSYYIDLDETGNIYIGDKSKLKKYSPKGKLIWEYEAYSGTINKIISANNGFVYFIVSGSSSPDILYKISFAGERVSNIFHTPNLSGATYAVVVGFAVDKNGNIYLAHNGYGSTKSKILKIDTIGNVIWQYQITTTGYLYGVAVDSSGNVYFGGDNSTLIKLSSSGQFVWEYLVSDYIRDIAVDSNDDVIIATGSYSGTYCSVQKIDKDNSLVWDINDFSDAVLKIDVKNDTIYASSKGNIRIISNNGDIIKNIITDKTVNIYAIANIYDNPINESLLDTHIQSFDNPHAVTREQLGINREIAYQETTITPIPTVLECGMVYYETLSADLTFLVTNLIDGASGYMSKWHIVTIMDTTAYTITFPSEVMWATTLPTFEANKIYEFKIIKVGEIYLGEWKVY